MSQNLFHRPPDTESLRKLGLSIGAVNTEVKALGMAYLAIGQEPCAFNELVDSLHRDGASEKYAFSSTHLRDPFKSTDASLVQYDRATDMVKLSDSGKLAAGLGGILIRDYVMWPQTEGTLSQISSFNKQVSGQTVLPSTAVRLLVIHTMLERAPEPVVKKTFVRAADRFSLTEKTVRKQLERLEINGLIRNIGDTSGSRVFTEKGHVNAETYARVIERFCKNPTAVAEEGLAYVEDTFMQRANPSIMAGLVESSIRSSGKADAPILEKFHDDVVTLLAQFSTPFTTEEIARQLNVQVETVSLRLRRLVKNLGEQAKIQRLSDADTITRNTRWQLVETKL